MSNKENDKRDSIKEGYNPPPPKPPNRPTPAPISPPKRPTPPPKK